MSVLPGGETWALDNGLTVRVRRETEYEYGDDAEVARDIVGRESAGSSGRWYLVEVAEDKEPFYRKGDKLLVT
jgi:hypothetical protein